MSESPDYEIIDDTVFELRPHNPNLTTPGRVCLRKNRNFTNRYLALAEEFKQCRMVEVGVDRGGSTSFFTKLFQPEALLAIELSEKPLPVLTEFLAQHDPQGKINLQLGVNQADPVRVPELVDSTFADNPLDIVVDDASHLLQPTTATFEMLFPRLRPGGLYIIEDWSFRHLIERGITHTMMADSSGEVAEKLQTTVRKAQSAFDTPMSFLICQLVIASGLQIDWITDMRVTDGFCELRRGDADIPAGTPISSYIGYVGSKMFAANSV
ncbi:MAG: class I SAM-dependent methyltransferase [Halioglobus sp.]|nr:class I SAM-dependent methyltransferase [Halioglobus sp.]